MAVIFADNFDRANGPIGNNWQTVSGTWETFSNYARNTLTGEAVVLHSGYATYPNCEIALTITQASTQAAYYGIIARSDLAWNNAYWLRYYWVLQAQAPRLEFFKRVNGVNTALYSVWGVPDATNSHTLSIRLSGTQIIVKIDGIVWLTLTDPSVSGGSYAGMYSSTLGSRLDNFTSNDSPVFTLSISPTTVPTDSVGNLLTLTTNAGNWTPGTPGSPTFGYQLGYISGQTVLDANHAQLTYNAPGYVGTETITDPLNGTGVHLGIGLDLFPGLEEVLRRLGVYPQGLDSYVYLKSLAIPDPTAVQNPYPSDPWNWLPNPANYNDFWSYVADLWLNLSLFLPSVSNTHQAVVLALGYAVWLNKTVADLTASVLAMRSPGDLTLKDVIDQVRGLSNITVTQVYDQITAIRTGGNLTLDSILLAISATRGINNADLSTMYDYMQNTMQPLNVGISNSLAAYRTVSNYTVTTILDAIAGVRGVGNPDLAGVLSAIAGVRGAGNPDLAAILAAIAAIQPSPTNNLDTLTNQLTAIYGYLTTHIPSIEATLADIHTDVNNIQPGGGGIVVPIWPGLANVTLGAPVAISGDYQLAGAMDGCLVTFTAVPDRQKWYVVGTQTSYRRAGVVAFYSDNGRADSPQYMNWTQQVYSPLHLQHASGALFHLATGVQAVVTPWTIS